MNRLRPLSRLAALGLAALLTLLASGPASALERGPYSLQVLVDGIPLDELAARGTTYIEALKNREYSIRLTNHTPQRIAVAVSVDGLNTIDARTTAAREAAKWIVGPYETIVLDGWQTSSDTARRFFFTTEDRSYGDWLGRTANLGVIAAAVFREQTPPPVRPYLHQKRLREGMGRESKPRSESLQGAPSADAAGEPESKSEASDDLAATGIGRELDHQVQRVHFRAERDPAQVLELRYEYRDALIALGVLPRPDSRLSRRERARGFSDTGFAPDPFAHPHRR